MIRLYLKIPMNFMRLILKDVFWSVYILFGSIVKCECLAQFPITHFLLSFFFFHWRLSVRKTPQVSWALLSTLADLYYVAVWIVSTFPLFYKSSSPNINPLVTIPRTPITIDIIITFMLHSFFNSLARSRYLFFFSLSFNFAKSAV